MIIIFIVLAVASLTSIESSFVFSHIKTEFMPYNYTPTKQYGYAMGAVQKGAVNEEGYVFAVGRNLMHVLGWNWNDYISPVTHEVLSGEVSATDVITCGQYVAVSASDNIEPCQGRVYIYHVTGSTVNLVRIIKVGTMPTKLLFTSDCKKLLVAIEGTLYKDHVTGDGFDPEGEVVIIDFETDPASPYSIRRADFTSFNSRATVYMERGVRWVYKGENSSFTTKFSQDLEPEDITLNSDETIAYILLQENNAVATLDLASGVINELFSLGEKSWAQVHFDASDTNGVSFGTWNVYSVYQPHSFKYINYNGQSYLVTANEGEQKEYNNWTHGITFRESFRGKDFYGNSWIAPSVDSNLTADLADDNALGRLDISRVDYKDSNGQHHKFLAYGGRSISLFKIEPCGNIALHWDSGSEFEDVISNRYNHVFNGEADGPDVWYTNDRDKRSDNSGPEPKSIEVGEVDGKPFIFVGLEYPGLIAMYSVDPETATPTFQDIRFSCGSGTWRSMYENRTCWDLDPAGLSFIPASKNRYGLPILVVFSTLSSTVSFYSIKDTGGSDEGVCAPSQCLNGGNCEVVGQHNNNDRCECTNGYTGAICQTAPYNYAEVLYKSILFYEAQRSGDIDEASNRVDWRGDSALGDGSDVGLDLTGGWYDAGDHVKFGFPMAWSATVLAWGLLDFKAGYLAAGQYTYGKDSMKWALDYFLKCHTSPTEFWGQVGDGNIDHQPSSQVRPEEMTMARPSYSINATAPGSDLAAETAAALAAGSMVFRDSDVAYADILLASARELYDFAYNYRGKYSDSITDAQQFYSSYEYNDELCWGAAWLYRATGEQQYLNKSLEFYVPYAQWAFSWDAKFSGAQMLLYILTNETQYATAVEGFIRSWMPGGSLDYTPLGLAWRNVWGSLRYSASTSFIALMAAHYNIMPNEAKSWAKGQIGYMLGDTGRSFVVGYGVNPPSQASHRAASCPWPPAKCELNLVGPNPHVIMGALVGGPDLNDSFVDNRKDFITNEVACDYNAGFQGAIAGLLVP